MTTIELRETHYPQSDVVRKALRAFTRLIVPPYKPSRPRVGRVAIVVPLSTRPALLPDEEISLRHLCHFLGKYDKFLAVEAGSTVELEGFKTIHFPRKFFGSLAAHSRLGYSRDFYRAFEQYEYILFYHPDALVFSDDLMRWCDAGWDYIGAPWLPGPDSEWVKEPAVGNGGFALMKVASCLKVLHARYREDPLRYFSDLVTFNGRYLGGLFRVLELLKGVFPKSRVVNWPLARWNESEDPGPNALHNDYFWAAHARRYLPEFKVATVADALQFAFEAYPRTCFEMNNRQLPFGCHAFARYDRAFWEPHLLKVSEPAQRERRESGTVES